MKKIILSAALLLFAGSTFAQTAAYKASLAYFTPQTAIKVRVVVEKEDIKKGPYAKFSQQYLGVTAPLNDKTFYRVVSATMEGYNETDPSSIAILGDPHAMPIAKDLFGEGGVSTSQKDGYEAANGAIFSDLGINPIVYNAASSLSADRMSTREKSIDEMAAETATSIFTLRKRRFDLVTGETSDNAFGEGLEAAIKEMARIENEYVSLFVGKKSVETKIFEFYVIPEQGKSSYTVCRFSPQIGVVDSNDASAEPITLSVTAEGKVRQPSLSEKKSTTTGVYYRVADMASCKLIIGKEVVEIKRIPVYQFGAMLEAK